MNRAEFFKNLFQFCEGKIELRALPSRKRVFIEIGDHGSIDAFCSRFQKEHLYFGVGTRDGRGGKKENLVNIPVVWADIDFKNTSREIALQKLSDFPFKPSIILKSGGGVHLYWLLKQPAENGDQAAVEGICRRIAARLGGDMAATDAARIMRIPGTLNRKYDPARTCEVSRIDDFHYSLEDFQEILPPVSSREADQPTNESDWISELMKGVGEGQRNAAATKLAGYYINKLSLFDVTEILSLWNQRNNPPLSDSELKTVIKSVGRYEPQKEKNRVSMSNVYTPARMLEEYSRHLESLKKNRFITGIKPIDNRIRGVSGGEVLTFIARSGSFKTATLQNLLKNYVQNSAWGAIFFSLELPVPSMTERYLQIIFDQPGREIEKLFSAGDRDPKTHTAMCNQFESDLKNFSIVPIRVGLADIPPFVRMIESELHLKIGVIGIDYLGLMDGPGTNEYEVMSRLAVGLKSTAKMLSLPIITLCQTSRKGGTGYQEIALDMARSSGQVEEAADFILGLFQIEDDSRVVVGDDSPQTGVVCKILKNRKGRAGDMFKLDLDPKTFRIGSDAEIYKPENERSRGL